MNKFPGQLRKGDVIVQGGTMEYLIVKVEPVFGGSWFNVYVKGHENEPVSYGNSEKVEVKG
jgi:hypothetical protein